MCAIGSAGGKTNYTTIRRRPTCKQIFSLAIKVQIFAYSFEQVMIYIISTQQWNEIKMQMLLGSGIIQISLLHKLI